MILAPKASRFKENMEHKVPCPHNKIKRNMESHDDGDAFPNNSLTGIMRLRERTAVK